MMPSQSLQCLVPIYKKRSVYEKTDQNILQLEKLKTILRQRNNSQHRNHSTWRHFRTFRYTDSS